MTDPDPHLKKKPADELLRAELELVYNKFIMALKEADFGLLMRVLKMSRSDEDVLQFRRL